METQNNTQVALTRLAMFEKIDLATQKQSRLKEAIDFCPFNNGVEVIELGRMSLLRIKKMPEFGFLMWSTGRHDTHSFIAITHKRYADDGLSSLRITLRYWVVCICKGCWSSFPSEVLPVCKDKGITTLFVRHAHYNPEIQIKESWDYRKLMSEKYSPESIDRAFGFIDFEGCTFGKPKANDRD